MGYNLTNPWPGIYYVNKEGFFPLQIIASGEMRQEAHVWLSSLRSDLSNQAAEQLFLFAHGLNRKDDVDAAQSILEVVVRANRPAFEAVKEEDTIRLWRSIHGFRSCLRRRLKRRSEKR